MTSSSIDTDSEKSLPESISEALFSASNTFTVWTCVTETSSLKTCCSTPQKTSRSSTSGCQMCTKSKAKTCSKQHEAHHDMQHPKWLLAKSTTATGSMSGAAESFFMRWSEATCRSKTRLRNKLYKKIMTADYELPRFISNGVKDLITKILNTNEEERYTIPNIMNHPWFNRVATFPWPLSSINGELSDEVSLLCIICRTSKSSWFPSAEAASTSRRRPSLSTSKSSTYSTSTGATKSTQSSECRWTNITLLQALTTWCSNTRRKSSSINKKRRANKSTSTSMWVTRSKNSSTFLWVSSRQTRKMHRKTASLLKNRSKIAKSNEKSAKKTSSKISLKILN